MFFYLRLVKLGLTLALVPLTGFAATPRRVCFAASDGFRIYADYYEAAAQGPVPMVLLVHDLGSGASDWTPLAEELWRAGLAVLAPELRGHGDSATSETRQRAARADPSLIGAMQHDLRGAYDFLAQQPGIDRARFALIGAGTGAAVALQYAAKDRSVDVVVCLSPSGPGLGLDPAGDLRQLVARRVLLVGGSEERTWCQQLAAQNVAAAEIETHFVDAPGRGLALFSSAPAAKRRIVDFVCRGVGAHSLSPVVASINSNVYHQPGSGWVARINPSNLRYFSSAEEAEARGLRAARSRGPDTPSRDSRSFRP
jgi:pimeloyl-ACP methyl ester carboxylesterase